MLELEIFMLALFEGGSEILRFGYFSFNKKLQERDFSMLSYKQEHLHFFMTDPLYCFHGLSHSIHKMDEK